MRFLVVICSSIVALIAAVPAFAGVTSAPISTGTPNYVGTCPVTINFTGSIVATAGTSFSYSFNRFVSGAQQVTPGQPVTIPGPSPTPYPVNDSITVSSSTKGTTYDQIYVHNISDKQGGHPDVYSMPQAFFSVTCFAP